MNKQKIYSELNTAIPYLLFYQAVAILYLAVSSIIRNQYLWETWLLVYVFSFASVLVLVKAGVSLRNRKRSGVVLVWLYLLFLMVMPIIRPVYVDSFRYSADIIFLLAAVFLTVESFRKKKTVSK